MMIWRRSYSFHRLSYFAVFGILLLSVSMGCSRWRKHKKSSAAIQQVACQALEGPITYDDHISAISKNYCTSCHSGSAAAAGLDLASLDDENENVSRTLKWQRTLLRIEDKTMPPGSNGLSECELQAMREWIDAGAPENKDEATASTEEKELQLCKESPESDEKELNRLSRTEYINSLSDLIGPDAIQNLTQFIESLPQDDLVGGYPNMAWSVSAEHIEAYYSIAIAAGDYFSKDQRRMSAIAPCWGANIPTADCISSFIDGFGALAHRRPIGDTEKMDLLSLFSPTAVASGAALREFMTRILLSPHFLYKIEVDGEDTDGKTLRLDDYAIASRLSFLAWESAPDRELLRSAAAGELSKDDGFEAQLDRIFSAPRAKEATRNFYSYWLNLMGKQNVNYSSDFLAGIVPGNLWHDAVEEVQSFVDDTIWNQDGDFLQLMTSNYATIKTENLADIYGIARSQMTAERIKLPQDRRGILSRVALLAQNGDETIPMKRGSFLLQRILCEELKPPDPLSVPADALNPPKHSADLSNRERWEAKTAPAQCQGCHVFVNPLGFAMESYDSLGRYRESEYVISEGGAITGKREINTDVSVKLSGEAENFHGATDLIDSVGQLPKAQECFVRQWFRFSEKRRETKSDQCSIMKLRRALTGSEGRAGSIREMLAAKAMLSNFRTKSLPSEAN